MRKTLLIALSLTLTIAMVKAQAPATIRLTDVTLMHEMREAAIPENKAVISDRNVSFQWPLLADLKTQDSELKALAAQAALKKADKTKLRYKVRWSQDATFKKGTMQAETRWPFFNPEQALAPGTWHWQFGYIINGATKWAPVQQFTVNKNPAMFCPPALKTVLTKLPKVHPRVYMDKSDWDNLIKRSQGSADRKTYITRADKALATPMKSVNDINTKLAEKLTNAAQREAMMTRESRRIIDAEEGNIDVLARAYLLTKDRRYADEALKRVKEIITWGGNKT